MRAFSIWFAYWQRDDSGVTSIEYGLIGVLIAVVIVVAVGYTGTELRSIYEYIANCVDGWSCE